MGWALLCSSAALATEEDEPYVLEYSCKDVVAVARINTLSYTDMASEDDLLGHGRFAMRISIKKVLRGTEGRRIVFASQIAHAQLVENRDFVVVLTPRDGGEYTLTRASLWKQKPRPIVAASCQSDPS